MEGHLPTLITAATVGTSAYWLGRVHAETRVAMERDAEWDRMHAIENGDRS